MKAINKLQSLRDSLIVKIEGKLKDTILTADELKSLSTALGILIDKQLLIQHLEEDE